MRDLESAGFGLPWGHTRSYSNLVSPTNEGFNGNSWFVKEVPFVVQIVQGASTYVVAVGVINDAVWFLHSGGVYTARDYAKETLTGNAANKQFILRDAQGQTMKFYDFDATHPVARRGAFESFTDAAGGTVTATLGANDLISQFSQVSGGNSSTYGYSYYASGVSLNRLQYATLTVNGTNVRRASYEYYDGTDANGSANDLRRVQLQEWNGSTWQTVGTHYYLYYKTGDADGVVNGLKYVVSSLGYASMVAAGITPETATNAQIALYSLHIFQYNGDRAMKNEAVNGGTQNFGYTLSLSAFADGPNNWKWKTTETLPDGNRRIVYTNYLGLVMLKIRQRMSGGSPTSDVWYQYLQYDASGRIILEAR